MPLYAYQISSLYTNTSHQDSIKATAFHSAPTEIPNNNYIEELLRVDLRTIILISVAGIITRLLVLTPHYANLFMSNFKDKHVFTYPHQTYLVQKGSLMTCF